MKYLLLLAASLGAWGGEAEALELSALIQSRHLPWGTIVDPFYASTSSEAITGYTRCGDSAIWTGHYLAAEAYRYAVTGSPSALANAQAAIAGIRGLVEVTGNNYLARCRVPANHPFAPGIQREEAPNGSHVNGEWVWIGNSSRDQYSGVVFGLGVAFDQIKIDSVRAGIRDLMAKLTGFLVSNSFREPEFILRPDQQLAILQVAAHIDPERFSAAYAAARGRLAGGVQLPVAFDSLSNSAYFKFNLNYINFFHLITLEATGTKNTYLNAYRTFRNATASHQNAFFNMIDSAINGPSPARDAETLALLDLWLKRPRRDFYVDRSKEVAVCGDAACQPIPVDLRTPTDFLWQRSPFQLAGGGSGIIGNAGVDYILPYWMARYYRLYGDFTVQSAAAPKAGIAANSIASLFGTGFGGVNRLQIRDSSGAERDAAILFASDSQVNFVVPDRTAAGLAQFTLTGAGRAFQGTAQVKDAAPALFSMNGQGSGVAAATAIRVSPGGVQSDVQLMTCGASGCGPVPIELRSDAPVYVSLYGTGVRGLGGASNVSVTVNGAGVPVQYAGAQPSFPGLDQVNIILPVLFRGLGNLDIAVRAGAETSNTVTLQVR